MPLNTDLNVPPYFDDYSANNLYYRVLFKPATAIQARELNQIQSILQNQIESFGKNIYQEGSIISGCAITFDNNYQFVKIQDTYSNGAPLYVPGLVGLTVSNPTTNLTATIVNALFGKVAFSPNLNSIYVKYLNTGAYSNGVPQKVFSPNDTLVLSNTISNVGNLVVANLSIANVGNVTGAGYAITVTDGVVFKKGVFIYVTGQTGIVSPYNNVPDGLSTGFDAIESIITSNQDPSLYDNALGFSNFSAPGADRIKLTPILITQNTVTANSSNSFYSIVDFVGGVPITINQGTAFNSIAIEEARRTYETNGNYVISPFVVSSAPIANTLDPDYATHYNALVSSGLGYVNGYRVDYINTNVGKARRGTDLANVSAQHVSLNFGYYAILNELSGDFGNSSSIIQVELHNVAKQSISSLSFLGTTFSGTTKIGTAYVRGFAYDNGTIGTNTCQYDLYLFDIVMNPGYNFNQVQSIIYEVSGTLKAVGDIVTTYNATIGANIAQLYSPTQNQMLFPFGQNAINTSGFNNVQFNYRRITAAQFLSNGFISMSLPSAIGTGNESFYYTGNLTGPELNDYLVIPTQTGYSNTKTGTVSISSTSNTVTGSSTNFTADFAVGDIIYVNSQYKYITAIANSSSLTINSPWSSTLSAQTYQKAFVAGNPIPFANRPSRSISVSGSSASISLGENVTSNFNVNVNYTVNRNSTVPIQKIFNSNVFVKIDCSTHPNGANGYYCLGVPDVYSIVGVYADSTGSKTYSVSNPNIVSSFKIDNGQRDAYYDLSYLSANGNLIGGKINSNTTLLVQLQTFTYNTSQGVGFFTANSYPIDDVSSANTNAIRTYQIPTYTASDGVFYDLRNVVDFRPYASNTANYSASIASATVNPSSSLIFNQTPYLPAADTIFITDLQYYLSRVDRIALDIHGRIIITEGNPAVSNPIAPPEKSGTMSLALLSVPPYPSLTVSEAKQVNRYDISIQTTPSQIKRYTMSDIGGLDKRIRNLEYYTSLSLLEQSTASLQVRSSTTGQTRFQNGIFVDPFHDFSLSNTKHNKFYMAIDQKNSMLRPSFIQMRSDFQFDSVNSTGVQQHGELVLLNHTSENIYIQQQFASQYRNCIEGNIYTWVGTMKLTPSGQLAPDTTVNPAVVNNIDLAQNFVNIQQAWGTQWGNWETLSTTYANTLISATASYSQHVNANPLGGGEINQTVSTNTLLV